MKVLLLQIARLLSFPWLLIPKTLRYVLISGLLTIESRGRNSSSALKRLFKIQDFLNLLINERAMVYESGIHPKHRLTDYHNFFVDNITNGQSVIDIGCGYGAVSRTVAQTFPLSQVLGLDINPDSIAIANSLNTLSNLSFTCSDITNDFSNRRFDVVILSNVLEHIADRCLFLSSLRLRINARLYLIRVPLFERDWTMGLRKELNINYYSDPDHKIEHTIPEFTRELNKSGYSVDIVSTRWGEIWAVCKPLLQS